MCKNKELVRDGDRMCFSESEYYAICIIERRYIDNCVCVNLL